METTTTEETLEKRVKFSDKLEKWGTNCLWASCATIISSLIFEVVSPYNLLDDPLIELYSLTAVSGITAGTIYYGDTSGDLTTEQTDYEIGLAISDDKVILDNSDWWD